ncbi:hypothetical protein O181_047976 [Austropuccinia psidii MF-1]|uniref:Uncharacterized protein n=1 Tax=Austropuccinia psidii MF-1 TaxID=1389203 RepID=A0A9Q3DPS4_9BASI|nr:hypothetical protein [Austropuccinia psidii MF-1]
MKLLQVFILLVNVSSWHLTMAGSGYYCQLCGEELMFETEPEAVWDEKCGAELVCRVPGCGKTGGQCFYPPYEANLVCPMKCKPAHAVKNRCDRSHGEWLCPEHTEATPPLSTDDRCPYCRTAMAAVRAVKPLWRGKCGAPLHCRIQGCENTGGRCYYPPQTGHYACPEGCTTPIMIHRLTTCGASHEEWLCEEHTTTASNSGRGPMQ